MGRVIADQSVSLDGFSAGPNVRVGNEMGDGGEALHEWMFRDGGSGRTGRSGEVLPDVFEGTGAVVVGRRMFDLGEEPWGEDPPFHRPVFVVTHRPKAPVEKKGGTTYTFVTDGLDAALARAREAAAAQRGADASGAGGKDVVVLGGADVVQQCLRGGLLDELHLHLVPILLGGGTRFFGDLDAATARFERARVIDADGVTHLRFRLVDGKGE